MRSTDIYDIFDVDGTLSRGFENYEFREGQLEMALKVCSAYTDDAIAALEAGTGIGKSFAYLVPAILWSDEHEDEKTVVATSTINLQRQLYDKDIVQLCRLLNKEVKVALLMGRGNYLCLHRLQQHASKYPLLAQDPSSAVSSLLEFSRTTSSGLRTEAPSFIPFSLWSEVCSDSDTCLGYRCSYNNDCFYFASKKKAAKASIIITNHHLLFTDAQSRLLEDIPYNMPSVLPQFQKLVIDEAHNIEKNATDYFTSTYSGSAVNKSLDRLTSRVSKTHHMVDTLVNVIPPRFASFDFAPLFASVVEHAGNLETYLVDFFRKIRVQKLLVYVSMKEQFETAVRLAFQVADALDALLSDLKKVVSYSGFPEEYEFYQKEVFSHIGRLSYQRDVLRQFFSFEEGRIDVYWMEMIEQKGVQIHISPLSVAEKLRSSIFSGLDTVVCTSATLDLHDDFSYWGARVGLPADNDRAYIKNSFDSPFDYKRSLLFLNAYDAPLFTEKESEQYYEYCTKAVEDAVLASQGGALILFTSYKMLKKVSLSCEKRFAEAGIHVLNQGEMERSKLLKNFIEDENSVLFATDSFWEGIDAPGNTLRLVIIVKLPFRVPNEPVFQARSEYLDSIGKSGFFHLSLPEATMKLKQGFGRLLRHTGDRGIVLILDSRIVNKSYGQWMVHALPESFRVETSIGMIQEKVEMFLYT
ncbi:MAG: ATP-dependent DNA helicase [Sphaerochaetaceae bacterium]|nr:ATP-dependent DNA helicase [Sphaerochaetaceae bacterium]MDC7248207.1 ATP-dependent DNA helicase [Sphaerochaetaceae bacterium]